jgi:hypothetical protein
MALSLDRAFQRHKVAFPEADIVVFAGCTGDSAIDIYSAVRMELAGLLVFKCHKRPVTKYVVTEAGVEFWKQHCS